MPIQGFKPGDQVLTPAGRKATVKSVTRGSGREWVVVAYYGLMLADRRFAAQALRLLPEAAPNERSKA